VIVLTQHHKLCKYVYACACASAYDSTCEWTCPRNTLAATSNGHALQLQAMDTHCSYKQCPRNPCSYKQCPRNTLAATSNGHALQLQAMPTQPLQLQATDMPRNPCSYSYYLPVAVVRGRPHCHELVMKHPFVAIHDKLVRSGDEINLHNRVR